MTYRWTGDFTDQKPGLVVCSFCILVNDTYPGGPSEVEYKSTLQIIERHMILAHGVHYYGIEDLI
jgi:hypothetical protein